MYCVWVCVCTSLCVHVMMKIHEWDIQYKPMCVRLTSTGLGTTTNGTKWRPASITSWAVSGGSNTTERCPSKISTVTPASVKSLLSRWGSTGFIFFESLFVLNIWMMEADRFYISGESRCLSLSSAIQKSLVTHCLSVHIIQTWLYRDLPLPPLLVWVCSAIWLLFGL